jgi:triacylglycerol esterase/lipase EstA (alpha/beta hydrolase family)
MPLKPQKKLSPFKRIRRLLIIIVVTILSTYLVLCVAMAKMILSPGGDPLAVHGQNKPWLEVPGVGASATDNYGEAKKVFVFCHGMRANREFFTPVGDELRKLGYAVCTFQCMGITATRITRLGLG